MEKIKISKYFSNLHRPGEGGNDTFTASRSARLVVTDCLSAEIALKFKGAHMSNAY